MPDEPGPVAGKPLKVFQWAASLEDGTFHYRLRIPGEELCRLGHEVRASLQLNMWVHEEADVVVGQRVCQPGAVRGWLVVCAGLKRRGGVSVYEVDDDLFSIEPRANPLGLPFRHPDVREAMKVAIRAADLVTVSTEPLAEVIRGIRPDADPVTVVVLPNCVTADTLSVQRKRPPSTWSTMYGWQGSSTHERDWLQARDGVVEVLAEDWRTTRLRFLGHYYLDSMFRPDGRPIGKIDHKPWTTDLQEHYRRIADFDVTLAPLERTPFNRSKSALRVIESLALGVPVIASDVPAYSGWLEDGVTGLYARSTAQWVAAMRKLQDPDLRAEMGAAGRKAAAAWTIEENVHRWVSAYRMLL